MPCVVRVIGSARMAMPDNVVIIVAMNREIDPLLRLWRQQSKPVENSPASDTASSVVRCGNVVVYCAGIGATNAARAARHAAQHDRPRLLVSAGLAGASDRSGKVGDVLRPAAVVDAETGKAFPARDTHARGVLVTVGSVVSRQRKEELARQYRASAVDMEAAAVGAIAQEAGVPFVSVKAISDPLDFPMPPLDRFIGPAGKLNLLHVMGWAALRPGAWRALAALRRNSRKAAEELARELDRMLAKCINED